MAAGYKRHLRLDAHGAGKTRCEVAGRATCGIRLDHRPHRHGNPLWLAVHAPQSMTKTRRQDPLLRSFELMLKTMIEGRIASFDGEAGIHAAELMAQRMRVGRPAEVRDTMIAGIVLANRAALATRNTQHFKDLPLTVINPWEI
jgi:hypothetical protein